MSEGAADRFLARAWGAPSLVLGFFAADRATKIWALDWLRERGSVAVLPFFHFTYVENTGAAFGVRPGATVSSSCSRRFCWARFF